MEKFRRKCLPSAPKDKRCDYTIYVQGYKMQCSLLKGHRGRIHDPRTELSDQLFEVCLQPHL